MTTADAILAAGIMLSVAIALAAVLRFVAWWFEFWYEDETDE